MQSCRIGDDYVSNKLCQAKDTNDAVAKLDNEAKILAGGMTLIPTMKHRLASPETLVDLADCGLAGIEDLGNALKVGAMTRHVDVETSKVVLETSRRLRRCGKNW